MYQSLKSSSDDSAECQSTMDVDCAQSTRPCNVLTTEELFMCVDQEEVDRIMGCSEENLMAKNDAGETLLHRAVSMKAKMKQRQKVIDCLISKAPQLAQETNNSGETALCHACKNVGVTNLIVSLLPQYLQFIRSLVESYPSITTSPAINIADHHNKTPLHYMLSLQLEYFSTQAIRNANSREEYLPFTMWVMTDEQGVVKENQNSHDQAGVRDCIIMSLLKKGALVTDDNDIIMLARDIQCCFEVIEYLLIQNPQYDINTRDKEGSTLLIQYGDKPSVIMKLLDLKSDVTVVANNGENVLSSALRTPNVKLLQMLRDEGAEFTPQNPLVLLFICQIYWGFPFIEYSNEWLELFETVISLPSFQTPYMPEKLISILKTLNSLFRASVRSRIKDTVISIVNYDPIKINNTLMKTKIHNQTRMVEPMAYIICEFLTNNLIESDEQLNYILEMIRMMLDAGFTVSTNTGEYCTTITALLTIKQETVLPHQKEEIYKLIKELISKGENIESMALTANKKEINSLKQDYCLPDALYLAFINDWKNVMDLLLQHWWAPPIALLLFEKTMPLDKFCSWYEYLSKYQCRIPHGTHLFSLLAAKMELVQIKASILSNVGAKQARQIHEHYIEMTSSPMSLLELSNYAVRRALSRAAVHPGISLPELFKGQLPIELPTKLYNCLQSEVVR